MRAGGSTTSLERRSRPPRAERSSLPSMGTTSETAAAPQSACTGSADLGEWVQTPTLHYLFIHVDVYHMRPLVVWS